MRQWPEIAAGILVLIIFLPMLMAAIGEDPPPDLPSSSIE